MVQNKSDCSWNMKFLFKTTEKMSQGKAVELIIMDSLFED